MLANHSEYSTIVMLCNFIESGREKCSVYFPFDVKSSSAITKGNEQYFKGISPDEMTFTPHSNNPKIVVKLISSSVVNKHVVKRLFTVNGREITHYHYTGWEDHSVPSEQKYLVELINLIPSHSVIHCSAGVGRSGSFVFLHSMLRSPSSVSPTEKDVESIYCCVFTYCFSLIVTNAISKNEIS
jgi:protein-tyrosine phosphatase